MDPDGCIKAVLYADAPRSAWRIGQRMTDLVDSLFQSKAARFLEELRTEPQASHWELAIRSSSGAPCLMSFSGVRARQGPVVMAFDVDPEKPSTRTSTTRHHGPRVAKFDRGGPEQEGVKGAPLAELMALNNELTAMQRELARRNALLRHVNAEKNRILGMVAHDLRTPLTVVSYAARLIRASDPEADADRRGDLARRIESSCSDMVSMVDDLVDFSAIESGKLDLHLADHDLVTIVEESIYLLQGLACEKNLAVERAGDVSLSVAVDARRFQQVLVNLLSNAIKFSKPNGRVGVEVWREEGVAMVAVRDQGPGIPAEVQPGLFEPFQRGPAQPTGGENSMGLGLAIARRIVVAHGGDIQIDSVVGQGTIFRVRVPLPEASSGV